MPIPEDDVARHLATEGLHASRWSNGPGDGYSVHRHPYDKVLVVTAGSIRFTLSGGEVSELATGDRLDLPAGTEHGALVGSSGVTCLEAHLPAGSLGSRPTALPGWASAPGPRSDARSEAAARPETAVRGGA